MGLCVKVNLNLWLINPIYYVVSTDALNKLNKAANNSKAVSVVAYRDRIRLHGIAFRSNNGIERRLWSFPSWRITHLLIFKRTGAQVPRDALRIGGQSGWETKVDRVRRLSKYESKLWLPVSSTSKQTNGKTNKKIFINKKQWAINSLVHLFMSQNCQK